MFDFTRQTTRPNADLFFRKHDANDVRLGEIVSTDFKDYETAEIVILGCPQDEGVRRNGGRIGAALAPAAIRRQFYKLTTFGISAKIFDAGDTVIENSLEEIHETHTRIVERILRDGKKLIVLGGGNDISYADGCAMANVFESENWLGLNIDQHFDVRADQPRNSGTPYRQLLDEKLLLAANFYETGFQTAAASPVYYDFLETAGVNLISLEEFQTPDFIADTLKNLSAVTHSIFWGFDVDAVRASDAPGTSAPSPLGLSAKEFCALAKFAGSLPHTKLIEFTEVNPNYDIDNRTAKLVAIAMNNFISSVSM